MLRMLTGGGSAEDDGTEVVHRVEEGEEGGQTIGADLRRHLPLQQDPAHHWPHPSHLAGTQE